MIWILLVIIIAFSLWLMGNHFVEKAQNIQKLKYSTNKSLASNVNYQTKPYEPGTICIDMHKWFLEKTDKKEYYLLSDNGLKLHAYYIEAQQQTHNYIINLHGYTSNADNIGNITHKFYSLGYNVLIPDARAHGLSEGTFTTMGFLERFDVIKWINLIIEMDTQANIILYGVSMGAATVMFTLGEELPQNVKCAIEDCGYSSVWDEFSYELHHSYHLPIFPILYIAELISKVRLGFTYHQASAIQQLKKAKIPILFIHGDADAFVPFYMLDEVYTAHPGIKEKLVVKGAGHGKSSTVATQKYWQTVEKFIKLYQ